MQVDAILLDLDGTVYQDGSPIEGVPEALEVLRGAGTPVRFVTNTTRRSRRALVETLADMGIAVRPDDCVTAPAAAATWMRGEGVRSILALVAEETLEDLDAFRLAEERPDAVLVGDLGADWTYARLQSAFQALDRGARLVALQKNRYWRSGGERRLDAGPFVAALEYASGKQAVVVGKPSREFFLGALEGLTATPERVLMVGDDLDGDVRGARAAGFLGAAVRTGKYRPEDEPEAVRAADVVLDSAAGLPALLGL